MYARINLNSGCTLQQLRADIIGLLTGTITTKDALTSSNTATSEVVSTLAPEWSFVQDLANTATRCHFVLSGVDDGGIAKTLGILITNTSGTLGFLAWACGAWNSATRRPAAINVTDWKLATAWHTASSFDEGGASNGVVLSETSETPRAVGAFSGGAFQLQIMSSPGATVIVSHLSATHLVLLDYVNIPRHVSPALAPAEWPFLAVKFCNGSNSAACLQQFASTTDTQIGLLYGPGSSWVSPASPFSTEVGVGVRTWRSNVSVSPGLNNGTSLDLVLPITPVSIRWYPRKNGDAEYRPCPQVLLPRNNNAAYMIPFALPLPHLLPGRIAPIGSATVGTVSYLDELTAGSDVYVGTGENSYMLRKA
jgi:hypothetical protein